MVCCMYADDLVIFSPYSASQKQLLMMCSQYVIDYDIKFNAKKSNIMNLGSGEDRISVFPEVYLFDLILYARIKYLGHFLTD